MKQGEQEKIRQLAGKIAIRSIRLNGKKNRTNPRDVDCNSSLKKKGKEELEVEQLEQQDMLKTLCHQKRALFEERWDQLQQIHKNSSGDQENFKHFAMVASQANYRKLEYPGYYKQLLKEAKNYPQMFFSCIDKDIPRTLVDGHPFQPALRNMLYCYAVRNPSLLYCQGMNYLVAFLLINGFSQEEGFWLMVQLIEDIVMPDYFKDLSTISVTVQVFEDVIKHVFPEFSKQMEEVGMESGIYLVSWYICLFTKGFINVVSQYLFEMVILQTRKSPIGFVLIKISLGILATLFTRQEKFQFQKDFRSLKDSIENNVYDIALHQLKIGLAYFQLDLNSYLELFQIYRAKRDKNFAKALEKQLKQKKLCLPSCDKANPVCMHRVEIEKKIGCVEEVLILKNNIPIQDQIIEEYFPAKIQRGPPKINYQLPEECPITHHRHICFSKDLKELAPKSFSSQKSVYVPVHERESSDEEVSRFSKVEDKFNEFSSYFIIDDEEQIPEQENEGQFETSFQENVSYKDSQMQKGEQKNNIIDSVSNVLKRALQSIKLLKTNNNSSFSSIS